MHTEQKIEAVVTLVKALGFNEEELKKLNQALWGEKVDILEYLKEIEVTWNKKYDLLLERIENLQAKNTSPPKGVASNDTKIQEISKEPLKISEESVEVATNKEENEKSDDKTQVGEAEPVPVKRRGRPRKKDCPPLEGKKITYNKDGTIRKPYTRRVKPKKDEQEKKETKEVSSETSVNASAKAENVWFDFLYENPNNPKSMVRSSEFRKDWKICGLVIPYKNKKGAFFGISFYEEKKKLPLSEALRKARSFPKYHGYTWEVMDEVQRDSILVVGEKLRDQLKAYHGDAFQGCYMLSPAVSGNPYNKIRYTINIDY